MHDNPTSLIADLADALRSPHPLDFLQAASSLAQVTALLRRSFFGKAGECRAEGDRSRSVDRVALASLTFSPLNVRLFPT
ncbi:MAG: hypothetical protein JSS74_16955 [Actinobacteria bacterium]|nr:hypothetical protein [Actinomycetota bacterium]